jgi:transposase-like protein
VCPEAHVDAALPDHAATTCPLLEQQAKGRTLPVVDGSWLSLREIAHAYVCLLDSTYTIAVGAGLDRQKVTGLLAAAGIALRARGAGGRRPQRRTGEPADLPGLLRDLYLERGLSSSEIGRLLGMNPRTVRARLAEAGIPTRHRGNRPLKARITLAEADLKTLYVQAELTADQVGALLDTRRGTVLRNAHETGLPVRIGGPAPRRGPECIELISALYADPQVAETLARHQVPVRPAGRRLWERFPDPVVLTAPMLTDLYDGCGLSLTHIELLTGRPAITVGRALVAAGVQLRARGGRSPFLRRWRAQARHAPAPAVAAAPQDSLDAV